MSHPTSCKQKAFFLCVSSHDISECLLVHLEGKCLFFYVYLLMTFQNVSRNILQAKSFSPVCLFSWYFRMSLGTSGRLMAFLLCVSSCDVSECLVTHPAGKGLLSCVYLRMKFRVVPINKGIVQRCSIISWDISIGLTLVYLSLSPSL